MSVPLKATIKSAGHLTTAGIVDRRECADVLLLSQRSVKSQDRGPFPF